MLVSLQANTPSIGNAEYYARIVEEHALLRRLISVAGEIAELGYSLPEDVSDVLDRAESLVFEVAQRRVVDTMTPLRDLLGDEPRPSRAALRPGRVDHRAAHRLRRPRRAAGRPAALQPHRGRGPAVHGQDQLRPGHGRPCRHQAQQPVLLFSLEMSHLELTQRLLCSEARVDATRMRNGQLLEADWPKIANAIGRLGEAPIFIDDNPNLTVMDIRAKARRLKSREGLGLVVVDYLQLMTGRHGAENRQVEVSEISRGLKILARELEFPVVALSQLSRGLEMRQDKRPMLADLRESGSIEQDADVVLFIYRDEIYNPDVDREPGHGRDHRGQAPQRPDRGAPGWPSSATTPASTTWPGCRPSTSPGARPTRALSCWPAGPPELPVELLSGAPRSDRDRLP